MKRVKVYVKVILEQNEEGQIRPLKIIWTDGRTYEVDRLKQKCRAASLKVGGTGIRYTSRRQLEALAIKVVEAYSCLPELKDQPVSRIDPVLLANALLHLDVQYDTLSKDGTILGMTSFYVTVWLGRKAQVVSV